MDLCCEGRRHQTRKYKTNYSRGFTAAHFQEYITYLYITEGKGGIIRSMYYLVLNGMIK